MTPFDYVIENIRRRGFHNQRLEDHSDLLSDGILADLRRQCVALGEDFASGAVKSWKNVRTPGARNRKIDFLAGEPDSEGNPNLASLLICIENKSVVTAHRNRYARFDDLNEALQVLHHAQSEAVLIATVIVGVSERVLNVPDRIKPLYKKKINQFERKIVPRLSSGDQKLWKDFEGAVSVNRADDPPDSISKFRTLPTRPVGQTHIIGYDYVLLVPAFIDNVNAPYIPGPDHKLSLGINVDRDYRAMLDHVCRAYGVRWHL
jgi:hypothetical protein